MSDEEFYGSDGGGGDDFGGDGDEDFYAGDGGEEETWNDSPQEELSLDIIIENLYRESKEEPSPQLALEGFRKAVDMEEEKMIWGFKSLKKMVKLNYDLKRYDDMAECYHKMLTYIRKAVTINEAEKALNSLLEYIDNAPNINLMYDSTLKTLKESKYDKARLRLLLRMASLLFRLKEFSRVEQSLVELRQDCLGQDGQEDPNKSSQLVEILSLEIQLCTELNQVSKQKQLYEKARSLSAINSPQVNAIIRECGGKMLMRERQWGKAYTDFFEAFKSYDEIASVKAVDCLKWLVVANIISNSDINPFAEARAKSFQDRPAIQLMTKLVASYQNIDIKSFEALMQQEELTKDAFIQMYSSELRKNMRIKALIQTLRPYTRVRLQFLAEELQVQLSEIESLLVGLILDRKINGQIDQVNGLLEVDLEKSVWFSYASVSKWNNQLQVLHNSLLNRCFP